MMMLVLLLVLLVLLLVLLLLVLLLVLTRSLFLSLPGGLRHVGHGQVRRAGTEVAAAEQRHALRHG